MTGVGFCVLWFQVGRPAKHRDISLLGIQIYVKQQHPPTKLMKTSLSQFFLSGTDSFFPTRNNKLGERNQAHCITFIGQSQYLSKETQLWEKCHRP